MTPDLEISEVQALAMAEFDDPQVVPSKVLGDGIDSQEVLDSEIKQIEG